MKPLFLETSGDGYWSDKQTKVKVYKVDFGDYTREVNLYFTKKTWDTDEDGLIYTDSQFLKQFRQALITRGVPKEIAYDIDYSEQGMQGDNYVSMEFGQKTKKYILKNLLKFIGE